MIEIILCYLLVFLSILWSIIGAIYLIRLLKRDWMTHRSITLKNQKETGEKQSREGSLSPDIKEQSTHLLVGKSKPFVPSVLPAIPTSSPAEKTADNNPIFVEHSTQQRDEENEFEVDYMMEEVDPMEVEREEILLVDEPTPEVFFSALLERELATLQRVSQKEDLEDVEEVEVRSIVQKINGTDLLAGFNKRLKTVEQTNRHLMRVIRQEEMDKGLVEEKLPVKSPQMDEQEKPLSFYL